MPSQKLVLTFPPRLVREPITSRLVKDHGLEVNILRASISPDEAGHMVVQIDGTGEQLESGKRYLEKTGITWEPLSRDVTWLEDRCVHCTACVTICPSGALYVERPSMKVAFESEKCIGCELCIPACMYKAMEIHF